MDWEKLLGQFAAVSAAPIPFAVAVLVASGLIWWALDWRYSSIVSNRDGEISLLKGQRDDYKDKLGGATPDQAKARIDALETRIALIEPRRLTTQQRASLASALRGSFQGDRRIDIVSETAGDAPQLAADLSSVFREAGGWRIQEPTVMGLGNRPPLGVAVQFPDLTKPDADAVLVMNALRSAGLGFDIQQRPQMPGASPVAVLVTTRIAR